MHEIQRTFATRPGYDCRRHCNHTPKGDHGICSDIWSFAVTDSAAKAALELTMFTPYYPSSVYVSSLPTILENFRSENLAFHFGYRTSATDVREAREPVECALLGQCYGGPDWALRADKFMQYANRDFFALGRSPTAEIVLDTQSALYRALEAELVDCIGSAEEERRTSGDLAFERCPHCAGEGVIAKVQKP